MYLLIPLILILASVGGIFFIVWRKLPHLNKLASDVSNGTVKKDWRGVAYDLCPEVWEWARGIKVEEYKEMWFVEMEKFLRRLRLLSLKMDRFSDLLIKKVRKQISIDSALLFPDAQEVNGETDGKIKHSDSVGKNSDEAGLQITTNFNSFTNDERVGFKKTEQKLILEIAKNPKNGVLYEDLGDLYMKMNNNKDAKESYEAAIELSPNSEELKKKLSSSLEMANTSK